MRFVNSRHTPLLSPVAPITSNQTAAQSPVQFTDITAQAGIKFVHNTGAFGIKLLPETMGSGVAFIDYDGDGYPDLFFVNGRNWTNPEVEAYRTGKWTADESTVFKNRHPPGTREYRFIPPQPPAVHTTCVLYHNNHDGTFTDVTKGSGLEVEMYGMGVAVGDYDNDGKPDLYVTGVGHNYLFHNEGSGKFREVAAAAGVQDRGWSTGATWIDYDKDGKLDLFVCHYVHWTPATDIYGTINHRDKSYSPPYLYQGEASRLYHNEGTLQQPKFVDVSAQAGIHERISPLTKRQEKIPSKALGVVICDFNNDGWPDLVVSNDSEANWVLRNNKNGTFSEVGQVVGAAYSNNGKIRSGMGIDVADIDHSNRDSMVIGNFDNEMIALFYNRGDGLFNDISPATAIGKASQTFSTFGCTFLDYDNDGWPDILAANGHIDPDIEGVRPGVTYKERPLLFHNKGKGSYEEIGLQSGTVFQQPLLARGSACADIDLDGDVDVVMTQNGGPPLLLRNDRGNKNNSIRLILEGIKSNRSAIGTIVKLPTEHIRRMVKGSSSYLSQSELPLTIGLGAATEAHSIEIIWPSGKRTVLQHLATNQTIIVNEDKGIIHQQPLQSH